MSDKTWEKLSHYIGLLPIGALFGLVAFVANVEIKDLDLWLHLGMGKFILTNQFIPKVDILSFSFAGTPWINHEWLFQVIVYSVYDLWGAVGLLKMQIVIVCITMVILLLLGYSKQKQLLITFMLYLVFLVFQQRFTVRPDIFSLLFFAIYIFILALHIDKKWALPVIFIIQVLWANVHGFFFFGPLFILIGIVSEWIKRTIPLPYEWNDTGRLNDDEYKRMKLILLFVVVACLINPYFIKGAWYPIGVLFSLSGENKVFFDVIQELQKPVKWDTLFNLQHFIYYKLLIMISFVSFIFNRRRIDISAVIFWIFFLFFSLLAVRNAIFFAFAAYLVIMTNVLTIQFNQIVPLRFTGKKFQHLTSIVCKVLLVGFLFQVGYDISAYSYYDFEKFEHKSEFGGISQRAYPDKAVAFLKENKLKGNFFNDFNSGAYMIGHVYPDIKIFIDGRTEVYGGEFFKEYQKIIVDGDTQLFEEKAKKLNIDGVILNSSRQKLPKELLNFLYDSEEWRIVYFDYDGVIFLKDSEKFRDIIDQYEIDLSQWRAKEANLIKMGPANAIPYRNFFRAGTLKSLNLYDPALSELREAIEITPSYGAAYHLIGQIHLKEARFEEAFINLRIAAIFFPTHQQIRLDLAESYFRLDKHEEALKEIRRFIEKWPRDLNGHYLLTEVFIAQEDFESVIIEIDQIMALEPSSAEGLIMLGELAHSKKEYDTAEAIYSAALKTSNQLDKVHKHLGDLFKHLGDGQKAQYHYDQAGGESKDEL